MDNDNVQRLIDAVRGADAIMLGAGAGLSTAAGYIYTGERFDRYFGDFAAKYGFDDMYSGGFYPYDAPETFWAFWSRHIWINRYADAPKPVYDDLYAAVKDKDYFVLTTNVDHCFQKAGFDKQRLFYTQGDYGLLQCSKPCSQQTWDNEAIVREMVLAQGFTIGARNELIPPEGRAPAMAVPAALLPKCPNCGRPMTTNLRSDDRFVEDPGWHAAARRYNAFAAEHVKGRVLYLEIGVGWNTPGIIKFNFWRAVNDNPDATYACLNMRDVRTAAEIVDRSILVAGDSAAIIARMAGR
ncbi:MAG: Sir2 silent information regulator family NAD-dependent deacetylase [Clostridia bacterium]|nr:Sir2 silent information regulator family NAD-dependent deacetylase [Clostridia bacterium]